MAILLKSCRKCGKLLPYPLTYCEGCVPLVEEERKKSEKLSEQRYNKRRKGKDPKYGKFYRSTEWKTLSRVYLRDQEYKCEVCHKLATEVHHVSPIQDEAGWLRRLDYSNLEALCIKCHNKRHKRF
mgnify:CR=1 FL=1